MTRRRFIVGMFAFGLAACSKKKAEGEVSAPVVDDASEGLLFIWIDEKGDARTEMKASAVPPAGRDVVRIVKPGLDEGTHEVAFLADLRNKRPDGTYAVRRAPRAEFEALALERRKGHGPTLATAEWEAGVVAPEANTKIKDPPRVVIYGASWCNPCHQAAAYFRKMGIAFVEKDIERDPAGADEMRTKLRASGHRAGSIPVLDVGGKILIGFDTHAVEEALAAGGF